MMRDRRTIGMWAFSVLCASVVTPGPFAADARPLPPPEIKVAPGFEVTRIHAVARESEGSWVSLASDDRGRLYASDQYGALYRITPPVEAGAVAVVSKVALPIGGAHGL